MNYAEVVLPLPLDSTFTYEVPASIVIKPFLRVEVPFKNTKKVGFVLRVSDQKPTIPIKPILRALDDAPLAHPLYFEWLEWASRYYMAPLGEIFQSAFPAPFFRALETGELFKLKVRAPSFQGYGKEEKKVYLSNTQQEIFNSFVTHLNTSRFKPVLLHGVTGSGKTEIYLHFMEEVLKAGKQILFLVPEIGLTLNVISRLKHYFGDRFAIYHSALTDNQRLHEWRKAKDGAAPITLGTRSALFMPYPNLGAIILDEEHDPSYKQEERFRYHARDLAMVRGKMQQCMVILGSATPSLESFHNAQTGKYLYYHLPNRPVGVSLPSIQLVDLSAQKRQLQSPLSLCQELHRAIENNLIKKEQTLILLNRRGFARSCFCLACQKAMICPNCSVNLVYHKSDKKLHCHYCDFHQALPKACPSCLGNEITLLGLGTETIEEELKTFFPNARVARLDRDTTQKKGALLKTLTAYKEHELDILVGTQMIAKGHDFSKVTLVGIVGIDAGLSFADFRASERTFQLLMQVAGRAGRGPIPGKVIVQSFAPKHYSIDLGCRQLYEPFFEIEFAHRSELDYPPTGKLIQILFSSIREKQLMDAMKRLEQKLPSDASILGPSPAPLEKIRGKYRWHILLKGKDNASLRKKATQIVGLFHGLRLSPIRWAIDVDPQGML